MILLDTYVVLWLTSEPTKLSGKAKTAIEDARTNGNGLAISDTVSPCQTNGAADGFEWNFSFGNGFQGTNLLENNLYVIVYLPGK